MESAFRDGAETAGLKLIETFGWDDTGFVRLEAHLARLAASAARLGWGCDLAAVRGVLVRPAGPARIRVTLDEGGEVGFEVGPLPPAKPVWRLGLAGERLRSDDPWLTVKSTQRAAYDAARAGLATGVDEVLFQNERGEVCDGTITTVFFDLGAGLCTPPLSSGLLPGVLRAEMLASGQCREAVLQAEDLPKARLWIGNSLRGLMQAEWVG